MTLTSSDGRDVITNVEKTHFSDGQEVLVSSLAPPSPIMLTMITTCRLNDVDSKA